MADRARNLGPIALGAFAGASLWVSLGTMAITDVASRARVAALPPLWLLAILIIFGAAATAFTRVSTGRAWPLAIVGVLWLPYLPGRWPSAFALWQGPIEAGVWSAALIGVVGAECSAWSARLGAFARDGRRAPWIAAVVAAVCYSATAFHISERIPNGDEPHYLVITQSLLLDHDLKIQNNHERGDYTAYFAGELRPDYLRRGIDEQIYSIHSPGISIVVLPAFAIAGYTGAVATVIALTATASALTWSIAWLLTASATAAWVGWAAVFLTTPYFFHGFTLYPDGVGALLVMMGVWLLARLELAVPVQRRDLALAGLALSALPWLHTRFAVLAVMLGLLVSARLWSLADRSARLVTFFSPPIVSALTWLGYFWMIWGVPDPSAPYGGNTQTAFGYIGRGLSGLLIDQQFGVLFSAPIYVAGFAGLASMASTRPRFTIELVLLIVPYVSAASSVAMWWGGVSSPARFVAAILPVAALPIAWWWERQSSSGWRALTLFLLLLSVAAVVPRVAVEHGALIYNDRNGFDLLLDWVAQSVNLPTAFPSVHRGGGAMIDAGVWALAGLSIAVLASLVGKRARRPGVVWTVVALAAGGAAMAASTVVWARHADSGVTPTSSQLAFLRAWNPASQTTRVLLQPLRSLSEEELAQHIEVATTTRGPQNVADPALFTSSVLPAADYDVVIAGANVLHGELVVRIGRTELATERWGLRTLRPGITGLTLHLPVPVHSVVVRGDEGAKASVTRLTLRLRRLLPNASPGADYALRAARYGRVRTFFMDAAAFTEPSGFWTRGQEATTVVIDADAGARATGLPVTVRSGPVPTAVDLSAADWSTHLTYIPEQTQEVTLPPLGTQDSWVLRINTATKFSPRDLDPTNRDFRRLGVWIEFP